MQKGKVLQVLDSYADEVDLDTFLERVHLLGKIEIGEKQIAASEVTTLEDAKKRLQKWLA